MNRHGRVIALILSATLIIASGCGGQPSTPQTESGAQVLIVYMIGSDLETGSGLASADIREMLHADLAEDLKIYLITGGAGQWDLEIPGDQLCLFTVENHALTVQESVPAADMTSAATLSDRLNAVYEREGPGRYALILWDHGMGPMEGFGSDSLFTGSTMDLATLRRGLADSPFHGENRFEWIGFDACLMASLETAAALAESGAYLLASQEAEPRFGWDYAFLSRISGTMTAPEQMETIADTYFSSYESLSRSMPNYDPMLTLSCMALDVVEPVSQALEELFAAVAEGDLSDTVGEFARIRNRATDLGRFTTGLDFDLIDLASLADFFSTAAPDETAALQRELDKLVVFNRSSESYASGVSIYCPYSNLLEYSARWRDKFETSAPSRAYYAFMDRVIRTMQASRTDCFERKMTPAAVKDGSGWNISLLLDEEQRQFYAGSRLLIFSRMELSTLFEDTPPEPCLVLRWSVYSGEYEEHSGHIQTAYDGRLTYHDDGEDESAILVMEASPGQFISPCSLIKPWSLILDGYDYEELYKDCRLQLDFGTDGAAEVVGAVLYEDDGTYVKGKTEPDLNEWSGVEFYSLVYTIPENGVTENTNTLYYTESAIDGQIEAVCHDNRGETLYAVYLVTDLAGNLHQSDAVELLPN